MSDPTAHSIEWDDLDAEMQAAVDRAVAKAPPLTEEKARRLADLLGLRAGGDADAA